MAIVARLEESAGTAGQPREPRRSLQLETQGALPSGDAARVLIHNISTTGLLLECPVTLGIDEKIDIELPHAGAISAKVIWTSGQLYGCAFEVPVSPATLSAAQLRSAVGQDVDLAPRREASVDASFGDRLQRLRKARGLSQAEIASRLGVSKPTFWAWEHGKARPLDSRVDALAEALGVARADLLPGPGTPLPGALIEHSKEQIAAALGVDRDKVRISIEF
jgi:transcriptional regulator with XRE-family HTH domain